MLNSRLKLWIHVVVGLACAIGSLACAMVAWQRPAGIKQFRADEEIKDAGTLKQQEERDVTFRLINATEKAVEIVRVTTSCTCTRAEPAVCNLKPGASTELTTHLRVGNLRGKIAAFVDVLYRVGEGQTLERLPLTITASVEPHYTVTPEEVVFEHAGDPEESLQHEAWVTFSANCLPSLHIMEAHSTHSAIRVEKILPDEKATKTMIHLIFDPKRCIAPSVRAEIIVHTDSEMESIHRVPVRIVSKRR